MAWPQKLLDKVTVNKQIRLLNLFDDISLESVIPKLLQYVFETSKCENAIWLSASEFDRLRTNLSEDNAISEVQYFSRELDVQAVKDFKEETLKNIVSELPEDLSMSKVLDFGNHVSLVLPVKNLKTRVVLGFVLVMRVDARTADKNLQNLDRDILVLSRHIAFSFQYWEAQRKSMKDDLTGLYNQRYLSLVCENEIHRSQRQKLNFSVLFMDVDYFKAVNDSRGHWVGSQLLVELGKVLLNGIRKSDYAFRYGGDEFVVVLPDTDAEKSIKAAERLRELIEKTEFLIDGEQVNLTLSIGIAVYPDHAKSHKDIIKMADSAMYCGKNKSRNIVFMAS